MGAVRYPTVTVHELIETGPVIANFAGHRVENLGPKLARALIDFTESEFRGPLMQGELMVRPSLRTKSIGTKVTEEEYAELERAAQTVGKTLGEWCRGVMLANMNSHGPKSQSPGGSEAQALMAELVALRTVLLNVLYRQANGESLTAEEMQRLIERADADKLKKAAERLQQGSKWDST